MVLLAALLPFIAVAPDGWSFAFRGGLAGNAGFEEGMRGWRSKEEDEPLLTEYQALRRAGAVPDFTWENEAR